MKPPKSFNPNRSFDNDVEEQVNAVRTAIEESRVATKGFTTRPDVLKRYKLENHKAERAGRATPYPEGILQICENAPKSAKIEKEKIIRGFMTEPVDALTESLLKALEAEESHAEQVDRFVHSLCSLNTAFQAGVQHRINLLKRDDLSESRYFCPHAFFADFVTI